jgi:hypothetical protein
MNSDKKENYAGTGQTRAQWFNSGASEAQAKVPERKKTSSDAYLGKEFHRKSAMDANKDQKNASELLKSATKGETLQEWFNKEKKKPSPKGKTDEVRTPAETRTPEDFAYGKVFRRSFATTPHESLS